MSPSANNLPMVESSEDTECDNFMVGWTIFTSEYPRLPHRSIQYRAAPTLILPLGVSLHASACYNTKNI